jgi:hypothetical protein
LDFKLPKARLLIQEARRVSDQGVQFSDNTSRLPPPFQRGFEKRLTDPVSAMGLQDVESADVQYALGFKNGVCHLDLCCQKTDLRFGLVGQAGEKEKVVSPAYFISDALFYACPPFLVIGCGVAAQGGHFFNHEPQKASDGRGFVYGCFSDHYQAHVAGITAMFWLFDRFDNCDRGSTLCFNRSRGPGTP